MDNNENKQDRISQMLHKVNSSAIVNFLIYWGVELSAFTLLPLIVYLIIFFALNIDLSELFKLPEWMFVAITVYGDLTRKLIVYYREYQGFSLKAIRTISIGVLGIVTASVFLVISVIAQYNETFQPPDVYYTAQGFLFFISLYFSAFLSLWMGIRSGEGELLAKMYKEDKNTVPQIDSSKPAVQAETTKQPDSSINYPALFMALIAFNILLYYRIRETAKGKDN